MSIKPRFLATGIGSMPFEDVSLAVDMSLSNFSQAPYRPQLPQLGPTETDNISICKLRLTTARCPAIMPPNEKNPRRQNK